MSNPFLTKLLSQQAASGQAASSARRDLGAGKAKVAGRSTDGGSQAFEKLLHDRHLKIELENADRATASSLQAANKRAILADRKQNKELGKDLVAKQLEARRSATQQLADETAKNKAAENKAAEKKHRADQAEAQRASEQLLSTEYTHRDVHDDTTATPNKGSILAILSGDLQGLGPETLVDKLSKNKFLNDALAAEDIRSFLDEPVPVGSLLTSVGVSKAVQEQIVGGGVSLEATMTPRQLMASLGVDSERVATELTLMKESLPIDGLQPWLDRAAAINRMNLANSDSVDRYSQDSLSGQQTPTPHNHTSSATYLDRGVLGQNAEQMVPGQQSLASEGEPSKDSSPKAAVQSQFMEAGTVGPRDRSHQEAPVMGVDPQAAAPREMVLPASQGRNGVQTGGMGEAATLNSNSSQPTVTAATHDAYRHMAQRFDQSPGSEVYRSTETSGDQALAAPDLANTEKSSIPPSLATKGEGSTLEALLGRQLGNSVSNEQGGATGQVLIRQSGSEKGESRTDEPQLAFGPNALGSSEASSGGTAKQKTASGVVPTNLNTLPNGATAAEGGNLSPIAGTTEADPNLGDGRQESDSGSAADQGDGHNPNRENSGTGSINRTLFDLGDEKQLAKASTFESLTGVSNQGQIDGDETSIAARVALVERLTEQATFLSRQGGGTIKLDLSSAELGAMEVAVQVDGDRIDLRMLTTSNSVKDLMAAELVKLREALSVQGLQLGQVEVGLEGREETVARQDTQDTLAGFNEQGFSQQGHSSNHNEADRSPVAPLDEYLRNAANRLAKPPTSLPAWNVPAINTTGQLAIRA